MRLPKRAAASRARVVVHESPDLHDESESELLARIRGGDDVAFGELFNRHSDAVRTFCQRTYGGTLDADDLTAETFFRVLQAVRRGTAQIEFVRAYLYTVSRRVAMEWTSRRRDVPVDDDELSRRSTAAADGTAGSADRHLITRAFTSLPERWRTVLWRVEVEGERPAVIAGHFGLSPNATAALARRAREGLRAAYLQAHLADQQLADGSVTCRSVVEKLGAFTAGGVRGGEERRITEHLDGCASCTALYTELAEVCSGLRANASYVGPVVGLGTAGGGHLGLFGKLAMITGRAKIAFTATAVAGAGAVGLLAGPMVHGGAFGHYVSAAPDNGRGSDRVITVCTGCTPGTSGPLALPRPPAPRPAPRLGGPGRAVGGGAAEPDTVAGDGGTASDGTGTTGRTDTDRSGRGNRFEVERPGGSTPTDVPTNTTPDNQTMTSGPLYNRYTPSSTPNGPPTNTPGGTPTKPPTGTTTGTPAPTPSGTPAPNGSGPGSSDAPRYSSYQYSTYSTYTTYRTSDGEYVVYRTWSNRSWRDTLRDQRSRGTDTTDQAATEHTTTEQSTTNSATEHDTTNSSTDSDTTESGAADSDTADPGAAGSTTTAPDTTNPSVDSNADEPDTAPRHGAQNPESPADGSRLRTGHHAESRQLPDAAVSRP